MYEPFQPKYLDIEVYGPSGPRLLAGGPSCDGCESFVRHNCSPLDTYVYLGRCTSWNLQAGQTETIVAAAFTRRPPCSYIGCSWQGGERDTMCLTRKWLGFVTHQTQICHHMLGFVRQQTQICHRILHLLVTANTDSLVVWQAHSWFKTEGKTLYLYKSTKEGRSLAKLVCLWFWMCALSHPVVFA